ncbi:MAG TPA: T9SS type A sorting domain-containing protein [Bacteroidetes bacterium]|nr:T9SS type A sorting domain-containing protein [Bacteroidota bacterium]HEX04622.1 T9SS type A sorting domain-containing protein [Bacteroidota bacterium]
MYAGGESDSSLHASYLLEVGERLSLIPTEFEVSPPWPNPFNPSTAIQIALPEQAKLTVAVYDLLGRQVTRLVSDENRQAGYHRLVWNATGHASGVYFVRVTAGPHSSVKKVMLLK